MREATRDDIPKGAEAQCPVCWRIFTRDSNCEKHKRYTAQGVECTQPDEIGLEPKERRGMKIWGGPSMTQEQIAKVSGSD